MKHARFATLLCLGLFALLPACDDDDPSGPRGPFQLTFEGDASFQAPHGGQTIYVAVVRASDGMVMAMNSATVSATADPAFSFTFANLLESGTAYQIHYWIDSNFGGGTAGVCDPKANDHQWSVAVPAPSAAVSVTESHNAAATTDVCPSFSTDLSFHADASFQGPHGGQEVYVAVVRASDGLVVARDNGTVSATADTTFSFTFAGLLVVGVEYELHYWIDSNFGGGVAGACDPRAIDHQWSVDVPGPTAAVTVTESHDAGATTDVCTSFSADLNFTGDASFQGPHGGQMISAGLVRASDGLVVATQSGTVSATADPSFSFSFAGQLVIGVSYEVHYWIDSNFGGGSAGVCDAPNIDHQWRVDIGLIDADADISEAHDAGAITDVCATFM